MFICSYVSIFYSYSAKKSLFSYYNKLNEIFVTVFEKIDDEDFSDLNKITIFFFFLVFNALQTIQIKKDYNLPYKNFLQLIENFIYHAMKNPQEDLKFSDKDMKIINEVVLFVFWRSLYISNKAIDFFNINSPMFNKNNSISDFIMSIEPFDVESKFKLHQKNFLRFFLICLSGLKKSQKTFNELLVQRLIEFYCLFNLEFDISMSEYINNCSFLFKNQINPPITDEKRFVVMNFKKISTDVFSTKTNYCRDFIILKYNQWISANIAQEELSRDTLLFEAIGNLNKIIFDLVKRRKISEIILLMENLDFLYKNYPNVMIAVQEVTFKYGLLSFLMDLFSWQ